MNKEPELVKKGGRRVYVLYIGIREYNGNFKEEVHFRNIWDNHETAKAWMIMLVSQVKSLLRLLNIEPLIEENLFIEGDSSAPAESVE